jgi:hypothetical protein
MGEKSGNLALQHFPSYIACVCGHLRCENTNSCERVGIHLHGPWVMRGRLEVVQNAEDVRLKHSPKHSRRHAQADEFESTHE